MKRSRLLFRITLLWKSAALSMLLVNNLLTAMSLPSARNPWRGISRYAIQIFTEQDRAMLLKQPVRGRRSTRRFEKGPRNSHSPTIVTVLALLITQFLSACQTPLSIAKTRPYPVTKKEVCSSPKAFQQILFL